MPADLDVTDSDPGLDIGPEALEALVADHLPRLRACAAHLCRGRFDPEDLVQDALVRALRTRSRLRDPERARAWLLAIVRNLFIDAVRRQRVRPPQISLELAPAAAVDGGPAPDSGDGGDGGLPWQDLGADELRAAIDRLPDDVRDTYRMFTIDGRDYAAIAAAQGIPKGTVGSRIQRARRLLRIRLAAAMTAAAAARGADAARAVREEREAREVRAARAAREARGATLRRILLSDLRLATA